MSNQLPPGGFGDFDASAFETAELKTLREEFEKIGALNQDTILGFDPDGATDQAGIVLSTTFNEYEQELPETTVGMQRDMLAGLGLEPTHLDSQDPQRLFQYQYSDGVQQIRLVTRPDGTEVPVATSLTFTGNGNDYRIDSIELLTHSEAAERRERMMDNLDEQRLNHRLRKEFDLDEDFLKGADLSLEDKRAMIRSYDSIQEIDTDVQPDTRELDKARDRLVRSTLPTNTIQGMIFGGKTEDLAVAYEDAISKLVNKYGLNSRDLLASEHLKRLAGLNERLKTRSRNAKIGKIALTGFATLVGAGGGVLGGFEFGGSTVTEAIGGAAGGGSGLWLMAEAIRGHRKAEELTPGFSTNDVSLRSNSLGGQVKNEKELARRYSFRLTQPR